MSERVSRRPSRHRSGALLTEEVDRRGSLSLRGAGPACAHARSPAGATFASVSSSVVPPSSSHVHIRRWSSPSPLVSEQIVVASSLFESSSCLPEDFLEFEFEMSFKFVDKLLFVKLWFCDILTRSARAQQHRVMTADLYLHVCNEYRI